jgi:hypothetical protein
MEKELVKKKKTTEKFDNYIIYTSDNDDMNIDNKDFIIWENIKNYYKKNIIKKEVEFIEDNKRDRFKDKLK